MHSAILVLLLKYCFATPVFHLNLCNFVPLTSVVDKIHAYPFATVADGSSPPPVTAKALLMTHGRCSDAMVHGKRLEPKLMHVVMIMLMAIDAADINMMLAFLVLGMLIQ